MLHEALHRSVKLAQLTHNLVIKVVDATVVLPQLLDALRRDKTSTNKFLEHALRYPLGILDITLVSEKLLDEIRVDELQAGVRFKHAPIRESNKHSCFPSRLLVRELAYMTKITD